jgi:CheY-like chemotaxis protein
VTARFDRGPGVLAGRTVLVVEDHAANRDLLDVVLSAAGAEVRLVPSAAEGLAALRRDLPDLLVLDLSLPGMSGMDLLRAVRQDEATRGLPVVVVTASAMSGDRQRALEAGADAFVPKPIDTRSLPALLARHVRVPSPRRNDP